MRSKDVSADELTRAMCELDTGGAGGNVAEDVAARIQQLIVVNELQDGTRLPSERDLAQSLKTSRPTISQAMRILVTRGLVESRRGSGAYVSRRPETGLAASVDLMLELNHNSVRQLADLRLWLETMSITRAIEVATDEEIAHCEAALERLQNATGDTAAWMSADTQFHAAVAAASHNSYLMSLFDSIHSALVNYEYDAWIHQRGTPRWLRGTEAAAMTAIHVPIVAALRARDEEAGRIAVLHHHYVMAQNLEAAQPS